MRVSFCSCAVLAATAVVLVAIPWDTHAESAAQAVSEISVSIHGRQATRAKVLEKALETEANAPYAADVLWRDVQRIKNFEVFKDVTAVVTDHGAAVTIDVQVTDRFTIIPVFRPALGGGVFMLKLGVRDTNFLGANQDLAVYGGPYIADIGDIAGSKKSYLLGIDWYFRQFAGRNRLEAFTARDFIVDPFYDYNTGTAATELEVGIWSQTFNFFVQRHDLVQPGVSLAFHKRDYRLLAGTPLTVALPAESVGLRPGLLLRLGKVDYENYQYRGYDLLLDSYRELRTSGPTGFWGGAAEARVFLLPHRRLNIALRGRFDGRNNAHAVDDIGYGGLDRVRGHPFNYLRGQRLGLFNNEVRILIDDNIMNLLYLQGVILYDFAVVDRGAAERTAHGAGIGIRAALIPVYGMFLRLDLAHALNRSDLGFDIGIGIKEFY